MDAEFGQPANRLIFDPAVLDLPLMLADREAAQLAREQCERGLEALRGPASAETVGRVRGLIAEGGDEIPSLDAIAAKLHVSARTLKRKLAAEGTAFSTLVEEHQRERAQLLLRSQELSIDEIASRLGYSDTADFIRARVACSASTVHRHCQECAAPSSPFSCSLRAPPKSPRRSSRSTRRR